MGERRNIYRALVGKSEERDHLRDTSVDRTTILRWFF
jgi:hypothetical protein